MPQKSKKRSRAVAALGRRWTTDTCAIPEVDSDEDFVLNSSCMVDDVPEDPLKDKIDLTDIADLFGIVKSETSSRSLSVLLYMSLTYFGVSWRKSDLFLKEIGALSVEVCNKWSKIFIEGALEDFLEDRRGGKHGQSLFDVYPELENMGKLYALEGCKRKTASFTVRELAQYIDKEYYKLTGEVRPTVFSVHLE